MLNFPQHVTTVERRGKNPRPSHQLIPPRMPLRYASREDCNITTPTHGFQILLHTDVPNVAGRAMGKKDGQEQGARGRERVHPPG